MACKSGTDDASRKETADSTRTSLPPDSVLVGDSGGPSFAPGPLDAEKEKKRQIILNLLSSREEINKLRTEVSDSLAGSGLSPDRRSLFVTTMRQLESSSDLINKQLENIMIPDLERNREKLTAIINRMKASQQELVSMINRLDKITSYMQLATTLMQTLIPIPSTTAPTKAGKENK